MRLLVIALVACSTRSPEHSEKSRDARAIDAAPIDAPMKVSLTFERAPMPNAAWSKAADVAMKLIEPWARSRDSFTFTRVVLRPFSAPDGSMIPFLFQSEAFEGTKSMFKEGILVTNGKVAETTEGARGATAYLHALGFPRKHIPLVLLHEIVTNVFAVKGMSLDYTELRYEGTGAKLVERSVIDLRPPERYRYEMVLFDANAAITFRSESEGRHFPWDHLDSIKGSR